MSSPTVAPAHEAITEDHVLAALKDATIRQLATALDPGAFKGDHGADGFQCPDCRGWSATVLDQWRWTCTWCSTGTRSTTEGQRTRLGLRARVADNYEACVRLVQALAGPGLRAVPDKTRHESGGRIL